MITIEEIKAAGPIPESFYNIAPGCAVFYASEEGVSASTKRLVVELFEKCAKERENFKLKIEIETTSNQFLADTIVARRLNLGSLCRYNLLMAPVNSEKTIDAFVGEFFNLTSRNDEALKWINKKSRGGQPFSSHYDDFDEPSFAPTGMTLGMIVMNRPPIAEEDNEEVIEKSPEQIAKEGKLIKAILDFADEKNEEMALELLERYWPRIYTHGDCKLLFTEEQQFWLKAGTSVELKLTKREAALYLFLLAHPKGVEKKRIADYKEEIADYYFILHKRPNGDKVDKTIDNLVAFKETRDGYKMKALDECTSRINAELDNCIMNRTSQLPFIVQNTDGVLHVDLPRKHFEWLVKEVKFIIQE